MEVGPDTSTALTLYTGVTVRDRANQWAAMADDVRRRRAMAAATDQSESELCDLAIAYLLTRGRQHAAVSNHTIRSYCSGIHAVLSAWKVENLLHPSPDAAHRYVAQLSEDHAPATCAARLAAAATLYRALRWARATTADPFAGVQAPRDRTPRHERRRPYSDDATNAIAAAADPRLRLLIYLTAHGGLRIAEALALRWADVRLDAGSLWVASGKGKKSRTVHLSATLKAELAAAAAAGVGERDWVVTRADGAGALDASWLRRRLRRAAAAAGVPYLGWHAFRHTAGTRLARETGNLQLVAAHLGHADVSTAAVYAKWSDQALADQVSTW